MKVATEMKDGIKKIYFDMDGVLADFARGVRELCACSTEDDELMWARIREVEHFYDKLEPVEGSIELIKRLIAMYGDRVEILTAIPKPKRGVLYADEDKIAWIRRWISEDIQVNIVLKEQKPEYCHGPEYVLVDDTQENIENWNAAGGNGVLFTYAKAAERKLSTLEWGARRGVDMIIRDGVLKANLGKESCVIVPDGVKRIGGVISEEDRIAGFKYNGDPIAYKAFFRNRSVEIVVLPKSVNVIGFKSFEHCSNLTVLSMTSSVKTIETNAFLGANIKFILFKGSMDEFKKIELYHTGLEDTLETVCCNDGELHF